MGRERLDTFNELCLEEPDETYGSISSYRDLIIWQHSMDTTELVYGFVVQLPENEKYGLVSQGNSCTAHLNKMIGKIELRYDEMRRSHGK